MLGASPVPPAPSALLGSRMRILLEYYRSFLHLPVHTHPSHAPCLPRQPSVLVFALAAGSRKPWRGGACVIGAEQERPWCARGADVTLFPSPGTEQHMLYMDVFVLRWWRIKRVPRALAATTVAGQPVFTEMHFLNSSSAPLLRPAVAACSGREHAGRNSPLCSCFSLQRVHRCCHFCFPGLCLGTLRDPV